LLSPYQLDVILTILSDSSAVSLFGEGELTAGGSDLFLSLHGKGRVPITGFISLTELNVDLGFKNLKFSFAGLKVNGTTNDLGHLAGLIQSVFDIVWTDDTKAIMNEMIRCAIDDLVSVSH